MSLNGDLMAAFNAAFAADGCIVESAPGAVIDEPIRLRFVAVPGERPLAYHPRVIVRVRAGSRLSLVESHEGPAGAPTWSNPLVDIEVGEGARLSHVKLQIEGESAYHTALTKAALAGEARYESHLVAPGRTARASTKSTSASTVRARIASCAAATWRAAASTSTTPR